MMKKLSWSCAAVMTLFVTVESLTCETCDIEIHGYCLCTAPVNCTEFQTNCYTAVARFSGNRLVIHERGCIEPDACKNETGSILSVNYTITRTCCSDNLCNGAASIQAGLTAALCAVLVPVWSQWSL